MSEESSERERKRQRNRIAQQRYRRRLKSHIDDLEKRAAVAERQTNLPSCHLHHDTTVFNPFANQHGDTGEDIPLSLALPPADKSPGLPLLATGVPTSGSTDPGMRTSSHIASSASADPTTALTSSADFIQDMFSDVNDGLWASQMGEAFRSVGIADSPPTESLRSLPRPRNANNSQVAASRTGSSSSPSDPSQLYPMEQETVEANVEQVLRTLPILGFDNVESFMTCYYTSAFSSKTAVKAAQEAGRIKGLPHVLRELQANVGSWSAWESTGYKHAVIHSAARLLAEEFDRLMRKNYSCEQDIHQTLAQLTQGQTDGRLVFERLNAAAGELKKTLRDELPNLHAIISTLAAEDTPSQQPSRHLLLLATIRLISASNTEPLKEAVNWVSSRANEESLYKEGSSSSSAPT